MKYNPQKVICEVCAGSGRVITLRYGMGIIQNYVGKPLKVTPQEAAIELSIARLRAQDGITRLMIEEAIRAIGEAGCASCRGTGFNFEVQQLTQEEARRLR